MALEIPNAGSPIRALVTGGLGFIGSNLVAALAGRGDEVTVIDRAAPEGHLGDDVVHVVRSVQASLDEREAVASAVQGIDTIYHVAANPNVTVSVTEPLTDFTLNVESTAVLLEAARQAGVRRFVYVSSALVYGPNPVMPLDEAMAPMPLVPYAAGKIAGETYARVYHDCYGLETVCARVFCVYGPGRNARTSMVEVPRYLRWHLARRPIQLVGDAHRKTRDYIHVDDVVAGLMVLAERGEPGAVYNLGSGEETSMAELVDLIGRVTDRAAVVDARPDVLDDTFRQVARLDRIRALGFAPRVTLAEGIAALADELGDDPEAPLGDVVLSAKRPDAAAAKRRP